MSPWGYPQLSEIITAAVFLLLGTLNMLTATTGYLIVTKAYLWLSQHQLMTTTWMLTHTAEK